MYSYSRKIAKNDSQNYYDCMNFIYFQHTEKKVWNSKVCENIYILKLLVANEML